MSKSALLSSGALCVCALALAFQAPAQTANDDGANAASSAGLMGLWARSDAEARFQPPASGPGPVRDDPGHPHHGHRAGVNGLPDLDATPWVADLTNPILKPWVAEALKKNADIGLRGEEMNPSFVYCRPVGVPG